MLFFWIKNILRVLFFYQSLIQKNVKFFKFLKQKVSAFFKTKKSLANNHIDDPNNKDSSNNKKPEFENKKIENNKVMAIRFDLPKEQDSIIKVIGIGGGGSNAVNHMYKEGIVGVNFVICNTDEQALEQSLVPSQIQLGPGLTDGRGAGSQPEVGRGATLESLDEIKQTLSNGTKMIFITAGMGGGTGTGGAPVVAKAAKELGLLTVGIVTTPFAFEGRKRLLQASKGIEEMKANVDTLIVISNDKLRELYGNLSLSQAFAQADNVLATAAKGIAEIITVPGYVNVDFEDVNTVMKDSGVAVMGTGIADGDDRALKAVKAAMASPLLDENDIRGAKHILLSITSGSREVLMDEVSEITNYIQEASGYTAEVIWGNSINDDLEEKIRVTVIATGFDSPQEPKNANQYRGNYNPQARTRKPSNQQQPERVVLSLDDDDPNPFQPRRRPRHQFDGRGKNVRNNPNANRRGNDQRYSNRNADYNQGNSDDRYSNSYKESNDYNEQPSFGIDHGAYPYFQSNNQEQVVEQQPMTDRRERRYVNEMNEDERTRIFMDRKKRLRGLSMKLQGNNLTKLEREPAYKRRNIALEDTPHSSESSVSKYSLQEDDNQEAEFNRRNPFLHDNVD